MFARAIAAAARSASRVAPRVAPRLAAGVAVAAAVAVAAPTVVKADGVPYTGIPGSSNERSFVAIKPDGVQRALIGEIITRFERKGYKLVAMKLVKPTKAMAEEHYGDLKTKPFFPGLTDFFSSGPIICMVWEGQNAAKGIRQMLGTTNPADSAPGSIRGDYCIITGRNIIHASDSTESAKAEIANWFKPEEVFDWTPSTRTWVYEK